MEFASASEHEGVEAGGDNFSVEDLLNFPQEDDENSSESFPSTGNSVDSNSHVTGDTCNSSSANEYHFSNGAASVGSTAVSDLHFSSGLAIPCDDAAELEWLSNFVEEERFSKEDLQKLHLLSGLAANQQESTSGAGSSTHPGILRGAEVSVAAKARSKRGRGAPVSNWASNSSSPKPCKKRKGSGEAVVEANGVVRRCLHCDTDRTPQWRTGPKGPKTLCNACGVRYKSGRLVPEYRPASSPTFVQTKHSSSHRKVMELRRQKEAVMNHQLQRRPPEFIHNRRVILHVPNPDEYLIHPQTRL